MGAAPDLTASRPFLPGTVSPHNSFTSAVNGKMVSAPIPASSAVPALPTMHDRVVACFQYGLVSVSITLFNRAVFSVYKFNYPAFFTMLQLIVSIIYILLLNRAKYLNVERLTLAGARKVHTSWVGGGLRNGSGLHERS